MNDCWQLRVSQFLKRKQLEGDDITSIKEIIYYGLKGLAAYADHALILEKEDDAVYAFINQALADLVAENDLNNLLGLALKTGEVNLKVMEMLDEAHTTTLGHPVPTQVPVTAKKGKAIVVSGHDLKDLLELLKQN